MRFGSATIWLALAVLSAGLWVLAYPGQSHACSCVDPGTPAEAMSRSAVVFGGQVTSMREARRLFGLNLSDDLTTVEFRVYRIWKGTVRETMSLKTARYEASCGFTFVEGEVYLVYSRDGASVSLCSRTQSLGQAHEDLAALGEGQAPEAGTALAGGCGVSPHHGPASQDVVGVGLLAGLMWLGLRHRTRR